MIIKQVKKVLKHTNKEIVNFENELNFRQKKKIST